MVEDTSIKLNVVAGHAVCVVALAGAVEGAIGETAAEFGIAMENSNCIAQAVWVVGAKKYGRVTPDLAQSRNIVED